MKDIGGIGKGRKQLGYRFLKTTNGEPAYLAGTTPLVSNHGGADVVEITFPILADLAGRVRRHRGATVGATDQALQRASESSLRHPPAQSRRSQITRPTVNVGLILHFLKSEN